MAFLHYIRYFFQGLQSFSPLSRISHIVDAHTEMTIKCNYFSAGELQYQQVHELKQVNTNYQLSDNFFFPVFTEDLLVF